MTEKKSNANDLFVLTRDVYDSSGRLLIASGTKLGTPALQKLHELGINFNIKPVKNSSDRPGYPKNLPPPQELIEKAQIEEAISSQSKEMAKTKLREVLGTARISSNVDVNTLKTVVDHIVSEILDHKGVAVKLMDIQSYDTYTFDHSINSCVIGALIGIKFKMSPEHLRKFALGMLLHDVGKVKIPRGLLAKSAPLTPGEYEVIKKHPQFGREIILSSNPDKIVLDTVFFHHERLNGSGYPHGLMNEKIPFLAKIAAVIDVFDAITSDRIHRQRVADFEAMKIIVSGSGVNFDQTVVRKFIETFGFYPVGTIIAFKSGEVGVVIRPDQRSIYRPFIKIIYDSDQKKVESPEELGLFETPEMVIDRIIS